LKDFGMSRWNDTAIFAARNSKNNVFFFEAKGVPLTPALAGKLYLKG
jgi:hypothetical protein